METSRTRKGIGSAALEIARRGTSPEVISLLERFIDNSAQTRHEVRVKLGVREALAAEFFALILFLCDDLLQHKPGPNPFAAL